jgi:protein TonB
MKFIADNLKYPKEAQDKGIQGRIITAFIINEDGRISDAEILRGIDESLDREALRVIGEMPLWTPGKQRGQVVAVKYTVPVTFRLQPPVKK